MKSTLSLDLILDSDHVPVLRGNYPELLLFGLSKGHSQVKLGRFGLVGIEENGGVDHGVGVSLLF